MLELITNLAMLWIATLTVFFLHELGHGPCGGVKIKSWFPIPIMYAKESLWRLGGLIINLIIVLAVFYYKPEMLFLKICGMVAFFHLIYYLLLGSFYPEVKVPKSQWKFVVFDDVDNNFWYIFVPIALLLVYYLGGFYWQIMQNLFGGII